SSASIRERVEAAREVQRDRFRRTQIRCNAEMTTRHLRKWCELDSSGRDLLRHAIDRLGLSARGHDRILKVARTIADLAGVEPIESGTWPRPCSTARWIGRTFRAAEGAPASGRLVTPPSRQPGHLFWAC